MQYDQSKFLQQQSELLKNSELYSLSKVREYHPEVVRHAINSVSEDVFLKATNFLQDEATLTYLIQSDVSQAFVLLQHSRTDEFKTSSYKESLIAVKKLYKQFAKSRCQLASKGKGYALNPLARTPKEVCKIYSYGENKLCAVLPSIDEESLAIIVFAQKANLSSRSILDLLPEQRKERVKKEAGMFVSCPESVQLDTINSLISKLDLFLREPQSFGVNNVKERESYCGRALKSLGPLSAKAVDNALKSMSLQGLAKIFGILSYEQIENITLELDANVMSAVLPYLQSRCLAVEVSQASEDTDSVENEFNQGLIALNKLIRKSYEEHRKLKKLLSFDDAIVDRFSHHSFEQINRYSEDTWLAIVDDLPIGLFLDATFFSQSHPSLNKFMAFLRRKKITLDYFKWSQSKSVDSETSINAQKTIIEQCQGYQAQFDDAERQSVLCEFAKLFVAAESDKEVLAESNASPSVSDDSLEHSRQTSVKVFSEEELLGQTVFCDKEYQAKLIEDIHQKGADKTLVYVPKNYRLALEEIGKAYPNFSQVIDYIEGCLLEAEFTDSPIQFPVINLDGDPGIGKTQFVKALCSALNLDFYNTPVSNMQGSFEVIGQNRGWANAQPGVIAKNYLQKSTTYQPCFLLDEIELVKSTGEHNIVPVLLNLFESEQKKSVHEQFLDIDIDCSGIIFFSTSNNVDELSPALRSRIVNFTIPQPNRQQMRSIAQNIYSQLLIEKKISSYFSHQLAVECVKHLSQLTPRIAKAQLDHAIRFGLRRASKDDKTKASLKLSDFELLNENSIKPRSFGFVH